MRVWREGEWLFLIGGSNDVLRLYCDDGFAAAVPVAAWQTRIAAREALFARLETPWRMLLAPEKLSIIGDAALARLTGSVAPAPGQRLADALNHPALVWPGDYLRAQAAAGYQVYPRTDSHWTSLGAFCAFQWAMAQLGVTLDFAPYLRLGTRTLSYPGDLASAVPGVAADRFERRIVPPALSRIGANPVVHLKESRGLTDEIGLHVGSAVTFRNADAQRRERLLLFGSSFSDCRLECSLLTFIAALFFHEVHFVWSTNLDPGLIERVRPDLVLVEMPERFITACPADDYDLASHAAALVRQWHGDQSD